MPCDFKDNKLLRVHEGGQQADIKKLTTERKEFLLKEANKEDWFELALRFGKELTLNEWRQEVRKCPRRKMVKLLGFDGGYPMVSGFVSCAIQDLLQYDVVLWDGDWFCERGWTNMIKTYLMAKKDGMAVAFQKRAEVPGFHRSYWELYRQFPHRIQIVVQKDAGYVSPKPILDKHDWLKEEFENGNLQKPKEEKYLTVAMVGRKFQGETNVIAMNGGNITTALAALETSKNPFKRIPWTVYEAWRERRDPSEVTLVHYAFNSKDLNDLTLHISEETRLELQQAQNQPENKGTSRCQ